MWQVRLYMLFKCMCYQRLVLPPSGRYAVGSGFSQRAVQVVKCCSCINECCIEYCCSEALWEALCASVCAAVAADGWRMGFIVQGADGLVQRPGGVGGPHRARHEPGLELDRAGAGLHRAVGGLCTLPLLLNAEVHGGVLNTKDCCPACTGGQRAGFHSAGVHSRNTRLRNWPMGT